MAPKKQVQNQQEQFQLKVQQKLYNLLNPNDKSLIGGSATSKTTSKSASFKISTKDPYQKFLAVHIKNNPDSSFLKGLYENIDTLNTKEDVEKYIQDNFKFY